MKKRKRKTVGGWACSGPEVDSTVLLSGIETWIYSRSGGRKKKKQKKKEQEEETGEDSWRLGVSIEQWARIIKNPDYSTGPLARLFAYLLAPLSHLLAPACSRAPLRSLVR